MAAISKSHSLALSLIRYELSEVRARLARLSLTASISVFLTGPGVPDVREWVKENAEDLAALMDREKRLLRMEENLRA